jgi:hypothetical protein
MVVVRKQHEKPFVLPEKGYLKSIFLIKGPLVNSPEFSLYLWILLSVLILEKISRYLYRAARVLMRAAYLLAP